MIDLTLISFPAIEVVVAGLVGVGYSIYMGWKKLKEIRETKAKKTAPGEPGDLFALMSREREIAIQQRDQAQQISENLRTVNESLRDQMREFEREVEGLKSKLMLLSELNRRLSVSLDAAQSEITRVSQTLSQLPSIHPGA